MAASSTEVKRVRFNIEDDGRSRDDDVDGPWDFLKYLLTLREEFNINSVVDSLVQKGIISADAGSEVMSQGNARAQIEQCVQEVMKGGTPAYASLCETLEELGYANIVDALRGAGNDLIPDLSDLQNLGALRDPQPPGTWSQSASIVQAGDNLSVKGKKMSFTTIAKDAKASQKEFTVIIERQHELEKQLVQVMKSLDTAKDMLIRERQEKLGLRDQLKNRDDELVGMQRKYLELQKAMGNLRETNNKYHEKVTKLQIENEQLRKAAKDKANLQVELDEKNIELTRLKSELEKQDTRMLSQEKHIVEKLNLIEKVVNDHRGLMDGQEDLNKKIAKQATEIEKLSEEKADAQNQMATQQRQLNFQQAQLVMLQEQMQKIEMHVTGTTSDMIPQTPSTPVTDHRGSRYLNSLSRGLSLKPFITQGKLENSKNSHWKSDNAGKKYK